MILGVSSNKTPCHELPVISQSSADDASDAKFGRQLLMAHNNWPIGPADMLKLEAERQDFWNACQDKEYKRPTRVEPRWFDTTADNAVVRAPTTAPSNNETNGTASDNTGYPPVSILPEHVNEMHSSTENTAMTTSDSTDSQGHIHVASEALTTAPPFLEPPTGETHAQANKSQQLHLATETWSEPKNHKSSRVLQPKSSSLDAPHDRLQKPNLKESCALESRKKAIHQLPVVGAPASLSSMQTIVNDTECSAHVGVAASHPRNSQAIPAKQMNEDESCKTRLERKYIAAATGPSLSLERNSEETVLVANLNSRDVEMQSDPYIPSPRGTGTLEPLALALKKVSNSPTAASRSTNSDVLASSESTASHTKAQDQSYNPPLSSSTKVVNQDEDKQNHTPPRKLLRPQSILLKKCAKPVKPALPTDDEDNNNNLFGGQTSLVSSRLAKVHEAVKDTTAPPHSPKKNVRRTHINETLPEHHDVIGTTQQSRAYDSANSLAEEPNTQSPITLGMLAEMASTRKAPTAPVSNDSLNPSGPREGETPIRHERLNGTSATSRETVVSFSPVPESERRPSPSQRGRSDGSTDSSIHRAGTPKSHNILPVALEERSRRRLDLCAPTLPDLKEHDADDDVVPNDRLSMPRLIQHAEHDIGAKSIEKERLSAGDKRPAAETMMEPPKTIKRQRSIPEGRLIGNRPPLIINRQRSTGSRLSFADEVQIAEPGSFVDTGVDRRPGLAAPSALRRADRQQSMESLQPPSVIRAGDRQGSVESYQSFRSQDSGMQTLTPNSRLTPSLLGPTSTLSPNADTPNTARMEELYDQLDRQLDECIPHFSPSPKPGSLESPGQRYPSFRPRAMNPKRQTGSALGEVDQGDLKLQLQNPLEVEKDNVSEREHQRNIAGRINQPQLGEGLSSLQIPSTSALNRSKVLTPTAQVKKSPGGERNVMSLGQPIVNHYQQGRNKTYPNEQTYGIQVQQPLQSMHRMASVDGHVRSAAPMQPDFLKAWLEGSTETQSMDQSFRSSRTPPQPRPFHQGFPQGPGFQPFPYRISTSSPDPRVLMPPTFQNPSIRNLSPYESRGPPKLRAPAFDSHIANRRPEAQLQKRKAVEFGHPRDEVVEGRQVYSRHTLLLWGAHKSDVCPVNGNPKDGCDSVVYFSSEAEVLSTKDDLCFLQLKCSQRNGGGALFVNYQNSQYPNAPHGYPIRVFRKAKTVNGATDLRYDGLYHVAAIHDDRGRPRSEPSSGCKMFSFLLKRNLAGQAPDQNQCTLEELWETVQQGDYLASHQQQQRRGGGAGGNRGGGAGGNGGSGPTNDLHLPPLSHGGRGSRGGGQQNVNGSVGLMGGLMHPELKRKSSAEVSLIHIRYFDDPQNIEPQQWHHDQQHQQQWHHDPLLMQRPQVIFHNRAPSVVPSEQPWGKM